MARRTTRASAPRSGRSSATAGRDTFRADQHPREADGQFRTSGAAKPTSGRPTIGEAALKTSGVGRNDEIQVLSKRVRAYAGARTVADFVDSHPRGRAYALRKLAADHKKGVIGFKGGAEAQPAAAKAGAWSGTSTRRDISGDGLLIGDGVFDQGLFRDEAHLRAATGALLAGVPQQERLLVRWAPGARPGRLVMVASNATGTTNISRNFVKTEGGWVARHTVFEIPKKYQGGGHARNMLRSSVEAYDELGVTRIETHANINVGGYAWARAGFAADSPAEVRQKVERAIRRAPRSPKAVAAKRVLETSSDDDLMYNLANAQGADGERLGRQILGPRTSWDAHLDLKSAHHRERLNRNFS